MLIRLRKGATTPKVRVARKRHRRGRNGRRVFSDGHFEGMGERNHKQLFLAQSGNQSQKPSAEKLGTGDRLPVV